MLKKDDYIILSTCHFHQPNLKFHWWVFRWSLS